MIALITTGLVLLPIVAVGVVLAWAESRARRRETIVVEPRLTSALLAARDDEAPREGTEARLAERLLESVRASAR